MSKRDDDSQADMEVGMTTAERRRRRRRGAGLRVPSDNVPRRSSTPPVVAPVPEDPGLAMSIAYSFSPESSEPIAIASRETVPSFENHEGMPTVIDPVRDPAADPVTDPVIDSVSGPIEQTDFEMKTREMPAVDLEALGLDESAVVGALPLQRMSSGVIDPSALLGSPGDGAARFSVREATVPTVPEDDVEVDLDAEGDAEGVIDAGATLDQASGRAISRSLADIDLDAAEATTIHTGPPAPEPAAPHPPPVPVAVSSPPPLPPPRSESSQPIAPMPSEGSQPRAVATPASETSQSRPLPHVTPAAPPATGEGPVPRPVVTESSQPHGGRATGPMAVAPLPVLPSVNFRSSRAQTVALSEEDLEEVREAARMATQPPVPPLRPTSPSIPPPMPPARLTKPRISVPIAVPEIDLSALDDKASEASGEFEVDVDGIVDARPEVTEPEGRSLDVRSGEIRSGELRSPDARDTRPDVRSEASSVEARPDMRQDMRQDTRLVDPRPPEQRTADPRSADPRSAEPRPPEPRPPEPRPFDPGTLASLAPAGERRTRPLSPAPFQGHPTAIPPTPPLVHAHPTSVPPPNPTVPTGPLSPLGSPVNPLATLGTPQSSPPAPPAPSAGIPPTPPPAPRESQPVTVARDAPHAPPPPPPAIHKAPPSPPPVARKDRSSTGRSEPREQRELRAEGKARGKPWFIDLFDEDYLRTLPFLTPQATQAEAEYAIDALALTPGAQVLDVGCGYGRHAMELAARGFHIVGLDLSTPLLVRGGEEAHRRGLTINFVRGDMRELDFDAQFDGAYCLFSTFGYFDDETNKKTVANIARALRPGGRMLIEILNRDYVIADLPTRVWWEGDGCVVLEEVELNYFSSRIQVNRSVVFDDGRQLEQEISVRAYSLHEVGKLMHSAGLRVLEVSGAYHTRGRFFGNQSRHIIVLAERKDPSAV